MFRGTLRYSGFANHMQILSSLGMLDAKGKVLLPPSPSRNNVFIACLSNASIKFNMNEIELPNHYVDAIEDVIITKTGKASFLSKKEILDFIIWIGFFDKTLLSNSIFESVPDSKHVSCCPLDALVEILTSKPEMHYTDQERDLALMQHELTAVFPDGHVEVRKSMLIEYANLFKRQTAMSRTVGLTIAIAAQLVLDGKITSSGVNVPTLKEHYDPVLRALEKENIRFVETTTIL